MISIHDEDGIKALLLERGEKTFRYAQIEHAIYKELATDFSEITTLSKNLRDIIRENTFVFSLSLKHEITSDSGQTTKFLFETKDGRMIEAVIMRHLSGRNTLCVSCQAGCPMACSFCATGKLGLFRNLEYFEILEQIDFAMKHLAKE